MLPLTLIEEVQRLLQEGQFSQRKIASLLKVSRGTVSAIASGKRGIYGRESEDQTSCRHHESPPERCLGCGGMVYLPCLLCAARKYKQRRSLLLTTNRPPNPYRRVA